MGMIDIYTHIWLKSSSVICIKISKRSWSVFSNFTSKRHICSASVDDVLSKDCRKWHQYQHHYFWKYSAADVMQESATVTTHLLSTDSKNIFTFIFGRFFPSALKQIPTFDLKQDNIWQFQLRKRKHFLSQYKTIKQYKTEFWGHILVTSHANCFRRTSTPKPPHVRTSKHHSSLFFLHFHYLSMTWNE